MAYTKTYETPESIKANVPYRFKNLLEGASKLTSKFSDFGDPGPDYCEFLLEYADGRPSVFRRENGY